MTTKENDSEFLGAYEVARFLGISEHRVYSLRRRGAFPPGVYVLLGKRQLLFNRARLEDWLAAGGSAMSGGEFRLKRGRPRKKQVTG